MARFSQERQRDIALYYAQDGSYSRTAKHFHTNVQSVKKAICDFSELLEVITLSKRSVAGQFMDNMSRLADKSMDLIHKYYTHLNNPTTINLTDGKDAVNIIYKLFDIQYKLENLKLQREANDLKKKELANQEIGDNRIVIEVSPIFDKPPIDEIEGEVVDNAKNSS